MCRSMVHHSPVIDAWCIPFMGSDKPIVNRTERHLFETEGKRPVRHLHAHSHCHSPGDSACIIVIARIQTSLLLSTLTLALARPTTTTTARNTSHLSPLTTHLTPTSPLSPLLSSPSLLQSLPHPHNTTYFSDWGLGFWFFGFLVFWIVVTSIRGT